MGEKDRQEIGLFRYTLIRDAADPGLSRAQRGRLLRTVADREHVGPDGRLVRVSRTTLGRWVRVYRRGGSDALVPQPKVVPVRTPAETLELWGHFKPSFSPAGSSSRDRLPSPTRAGDVRRRSSPPRRRRPPAATVAHEPLPSATILIAVGIGLVDRHARRSSRTATGRRVLLEALPLVGVQSVARCRERTRVHASPRRADTRTWCGADGSGRGRRLARP